MRPGRRAWRGLFSALLGATPRGFRERNRLELLDAFERSLDEAGTGSVSMHGRAARECLDLLGVALRERARIVGDRLAAVSWIDVKLGVRMLAKYPGITVIGTVSLVVGIALASSFEVACPSTRATAWSASSSGTARPATKIDGSRTISCGGATASRR